ncbi:MAG: hypothetical protein V4588_03150 [Pseudomonadota bacterium]
MRPLVDENGIPFFEGESHETTVRYLGIEVDDALEIAEQTEVQGLAGSCLSDCNMALAN